MDNESLEEATPRIEWQGSSADVTREGLLRPLLGQTVLALHRPALVGRYDHESADHVHACTASLVFTLRDGRRWELLDAQSSDMRVLVFKEIHDDQDLMTAMDLSREPQEQVTMVPIPGSGPRPLRSISGITEVWSLATASPFLRGVALWGAPARYDYAQRGLLLGIYVAGDDLEIKADEEFWSLLRSDHFFMTPSLYHFYDEGH